MLFDWVGGLFVLDSVFVGDNVMIICNFIWLGVVLFYIVCYESIVSVVVYGELYWLVMLMLWLMVGGCYGWDWIIGCGIVWIDVVVCSVVVCVVFSGMWGNVWFGVLFWMFGLDW